MRLTFIVLFLSPFYESNKVILITALSNCIIPSHPSHELMPSGGFICNRYNCYLYMTQGQNGPNIISIIESFSLF